MPQAVYILFGALYTIGVSYALGAILLKPVRLYREEAWLFRFVTGASVLHLLVFLILAAGIGKKAAFLVLGAIVLAAAWRGGALRTAGLDRLPPLTGWWRFLFPAVLAAFGLLYAINAMAPEMSPDGSAYHLGLVARYLRQRGFGWITTNMYANLSQGVEMLYTFAFAFGRHSSASLVHCAFTLALPGILLNYGRRFGFPAAGAAAGLLVFCAPLVGIDGTTAYIDVAVTCIVFTLFVLLQIWDVERHPRLLIACGLLAGYCFASKYTVGSMMPYAAAFVFWKLWRGRKAWLRPVAVLCGCMLLMAGPWMLKNWIVVGNPVSPFANRFFPNPNIRIAFEEEYVTMMRNYGNPPSKAVIPLDVTVNGHYLNGMYGPVFVLTPLALFSLWRREGRRLLLAGIILALPYANNIGARFLMPALPFFTMALALACQRSRGVLPFLAGVHAVLSWPTVMPFYCSPYAWRLTEIPVRAALRLVSEEQYLTNQFGGYLIARMVEDFVPPGEKVFTFAGVAEAYTTREVLVAYQAASNAFLGDVIWNALFPDYAPNGRLRFAFEKQRVRRLRVRQSARGTEQWSISEFRVHSGEKELPRSPDWRLRANPNSWEISYAFDNSPVTRWRTQESIRDGMWVELDLGHEAEVSSVTLEIVQDQSQVALSLEGQAEKGDWFKLADAPEFSQVPVQKGLRRAAMKELLAHGVRYILVAPDDAAVDDYRQNARIWGLRPLAERNGIRLYRIETTEQQ